MRGSAIFRRSAAHGSLDIPSIQEILRLWTLDPLSSMGQFGFKNVKSKKTEEIHLVFDFETGSQERAEIFAGRLCDASEELGLIDVYLHFS